MTVYKKVRQLSSVEAAYIAGLIDGEGTITLTRKSKDGHRSVAVTIANTEVALLEYPKVIIGVGRISSKKISKSSHTPSFVYVVTGRQALALLQQIAPFMHSYKKQRAELVLDKYIRLTPRNGKYTIAILEERERFIDSFFRYRST